MPKLVMKEQVFAAIEAPLWRGLSGDAFVTVETQVLVEFHFIFTRYSFPSRLLYRQWRPCRQRYGSSEGPSRAQTFDRNEDSIRKVFLVLIKSPGAFCSLHKNKTSNQVRLRNNKSLSPGPKSTISALKGCEVRNTYIRPLHYRLMAPKHIPDRKKNTRITTASVTIHNHELLPNIKKNKGGILSLCGATES